MLKKGHCYAQNIFREGNWNKTRNWEVNEKANDGGLNWVWFLNVWGIEKVITWFFASW